MIAFALILALAMWIGCWALAVFLRSESNNARSIVVAGWSLIPTWIAVENNAFQPFLMAAIVLPTVFLMYRHVRAQARIHAMIRKEKSGRGNR